MKLLFRFFDPDEGRVLINGQNIKDLDLFSVRKVIGVVPQVNFTRCFNECEDINSKETLQYLLIMILVTDNIQMFDTSFMIFVRDHKYHE